MQVNTVVSGEMSYGEMEGLDGIGFVEGTVEGQDQLDPDEGGVGMRRRRLGTWADRWHEKKA